MTKPATCQAYLPAEFLWGPRTARFTETAGDTDEARVAFNALPRAPPLQKAEEAANILYFYQDYQNVVWSPEGNHLVSNVDRWELTLYADHRHAFHVQLIFSRHPEKGVLRLSILLLNAGRKPIKVEGQSAYILFDELRNAGSVSQQILKDFCCHFDLDLNTLQVAIHTSYRRADELGLLP